LLGINGTKLIENAIVDTTQMDSKNQNSCKTKNNKNKTKSGLHNLIVYSVWRVTFFFYFFNADFAYSAER